MPKLGAESAAPGLMSMTSMVPAAVPSVTHSSRPVPVPVVVTAAVVVVEAVIGRP